MPCADEAWTPQSIEVFSQSVAYVWAINECIAECKLGCLDEYVKSLAYWIRETADRLDIGALDAALLALSFFKKFASKRSMRVTPSTETVVLAIALMHSDLPK